MENRTPIFWAVVVLLILAAVVVFPWASEGESSPAPADARRSEAERATSEAKPETAAPAVVEDSVPTPTAESDSLQATDAGPCDGE